MCGRKDGELGGKKVVFLTFFGVARCILTGVTHLPIEVPGSVLQNVIPEETIERDNLHLLRIGNTPPNEK